MGIRTGEEGRRKLAGDAIMMQEQLQEQDDIIFT
jgi:hypothetical protein